MKAEKFTEILGDDLKQRVELPDHRGDEAYQSFEEHAERINEEVEYVTIQSHANYDNMDVECSHS